MAESSFIVDIDSLRMGRSVVEFTFLVPMVVWMNC